MGMGDGIGEGGRRGNIIKHDKNVTFYMFMIVICHEPKNLT